MVENNNDNGVVMIDTTTDGSQSTASTSKPATQTKPLLKLGAKRRFGAKKPDEEEEVKSGITCHFRDCGRSFPTDSHLK